ncbi:MAG: hypothetical protein ACREQM_01505 [Candidatus Dormibacteraceae bacterium]
MTVAHSVAEVLAEHVSFEVECIDRMYLNVYVPRLQYDGGVIQFIRRHLGMPMASTAPLAKVRENYCEEVHRFAEQHRIRWVNFTKGQRKDGVMQEHLASYGDREGVVFIGRAQEKTSVFRTEKRRNKKGVTYPWVVKTTGVVNQFYFYCVDEDFGPFFLKFCSYFPYNAKLCINGNHWAQQQAQKAGIAFTPMDNAFADVDDPRALQAICDRLGSEQIEDLLFKWLRILPDPFTDRDRAAGYGYNISILQAEFSLTQKLDRPLSGRIFFENVIRENLDTGRPDQVGLIFKRRIFDGRKHSTPGQFRTRVITDGVTPSLHLDYKHTRIKQYHKEGQALRTETTINDTHDFRIGKRLVNLPALREIGFSANRRLLGAQRLDHDPIQGVAILDQIIKPITSDIGTRVSGFALGDERSHALLAALQVFRTELPGGFRNADLRPLVAQFRGLRPETTTAGQMTYDLRRLREHGLIERVPHTNRYRITALGRRAAMLITRVEERVLPTGFARLTDPVPSPTALHTAEVAMNAAIDHLLREQGVAA